MRRNVSTRSVSPTKKGTNMTITKSLAILKDPATHQWVKDQYHAAFDRDPYDALNDAELLTELLRTRLNSILGAF